MWVIYKSLEIKKKFPWENYSIKADGKKIPREKIVIW